MDLAEAMGPGCIGYQLPDGGVVHETKFNSLRTLNETRLSDAMNMLNMEDLTGDDPGVSILRAITLARTVPGKQIKIDHRCRNTDLPMAPETVVQCAGRLCDATARVTANRVAMTAERVVLKERIASLGAKICKWMLDDEIPSILAPSPCGGPGDKVTFTLRERKKSTKMDKADLAKKVNEAVGVLRAGAGWMEMPIEDARATIAAYILKSIRLDRSQTKTSLFLATRLHRG
jgi:hypothetical protein